MLETIREIWAFLWARKLFWLAPILVMLFLIGLLIFVAGQSAIVSPFLYAL